MDEVGKERDTGVVRVRVNPKFFRPAEVVSGVCLRETLKGDTRMHCSPPCCMLYKMHCGVLNS